VGAVQRSYTTKNTKAIRREGDETTKRDGAKITKLVRAQTFAVLA
jgi:hypothetical protein